MSELRLGTSAPNRGRVDSPRIGGLKIAVEQQTAPLQSGRSAPEGGSPPSAQAEDGPPSLPEIILADARIAAAYREERHEFRSRLDGLVQALRLMVQTDAFLALTAYRVKAQLRARRIPVLPWIAHRVAIGSGQVSIADSAVVHPGVFIPSGQVVILGETEVKPGVSLAAGSMLAPIAASVTGPTIGPLARIGPGAKVMGEVDVGANARVGANAVVLDDVPANTTVVGIPARPVKG